ncbi:MAG: hypothetical protein J3K34DRAFT_436579 [Monoraphidium minutum]|nr:MAG: hypothetical protein J3K34DRAFT_436579 [Monoraphidium minutum]
MAPTAPALAGRPPPRVRAAAAPHLLAAAGVRACACCCSPMHFCTHKELNARRRPPLRPCAPLRAGLRRIPQPPCSQARAAVRDFPTLSARPRLFLPFVHSVLLRGAGKRVRGPNQSAQNRRRPGPPRPRPRSRAGWGSHEFVQGEPQSRGARLQRDP